MPGATLMFQPRAAQEKAATLAFRPAAQATVPPLGQMPHKNHLAPAMVLHLVSTISGFG